MQHVHKTEILEDNYLRWIHASIKVLETIKEILEAARIKISAYKFSEIEPLIEELNHPELNLSGLNAYPNNIFGETIQLDDDFAGLNYDYESLLMETQENCLDRPRIWNRIERRLVELFEPGEKIKNRVYKHHRELGGSVRDVLDTMKEIKQNLELLKDSTNPTETIETIETVNTAVNNLHNTFISTIPKKNIIKILKKLHDDMKFFPTILENYLTAKPIWAFHEAFTKELIDLNRQMWYLYQDKLTAEPQQTFMWLEIAGFLKDDTQALAGMNHELSLLNKHDLDEFIALVHNTSVFNTSEMLQICLGLNLTLEDAEYYIKNPYNLVSNFYFDFKELISNTYKDTIKNLSPEKEYEFIHVIQKYRFKMQNWHKEINRPSSLMGRMYVREFDTCRQNMISIQHCISKYDGEQLDEHSRIYIENLKSALDSHIKITLQVNDMFTTDYLEMLLRANNWRKEFNREFEEFLKEEQKAQQEQEHLEPIHSH